MRFNNMQFFQAAAHNVRYWGYLSQKAFSLPISAVASNIYITKSIGELLFEGYPDSLLQLKASVPLIKQSEDKFGLLYKVCGFCHFLNKFNDNFRKMVHLQMVFLILEPVLKRNLANFITGGIEIGQISTKVSVAIWTDVWAIFLNQG